MAGPQRTAPRRARPGTAEAKARTSPDLGAATPAHGARSRGVEATTSRHPRPPTTRERLETALHRQPPASDTRSRPAGSETATVRAPAPSEAVPGRAAQTRPGAIRRHAPGRASARQSPGPCTDQRPARSRSGAAIDRHASSRRPGRRRRAVTERIVTSDRQRPRATGARPAEPLARPDQALRHQSD